MAELQRESEVRATYDAISYDYARAFRATEPEQGPELAMIDRFAAGLPLGDARPRLARQAARLPPTPRPLVLDAGCGAGRLLPRLTQRGCRVTGIDLSPGMLACSRRDHPEFAVGLASLTALPFRDAAFDGYFSWYSTIHLPDDRLAQAFAEAGRVVRPGGLVLVAFQAGRGVRDVAAGMRARGHDVVLHRWHRTADEVSEALGAHGLVESARLVRGPVAPEQDPQAVLIATRAR